MELHGRRLLDYLPGIYHSEHMERFLGIFEATLNPIEWTIDNFDLFLNPATAPGAFLGWLAEWFDITFDPSWSDTQRRQLLPRGVRHLCPPRHAMVVAPGSGDLHRAGAADR